MTLDVSRDGLQVAADRTGYWKGQQLSVTFPYSVNAFDPASAEAHATGHAQELQKSVVLAIEPDARSADTLRNMLQQDGYTVVTVPTAQDALEVLKTTVPAVFIAEVECEDMSGHDLCLIIKRNDRLQRVPVIC
jgi:PleD family two-component response regulator